MTARDAGRTRRRWRAAAPLVLLATAGTALVLGRCPGSATRGNPGPPLAASAERRKMAPFELPDAISGNTYRLGERTLGKVVLVNYWATWCPPCRAEQPALSRIATAYRARGLEVVGVSLDTDDPPAAVRRYGAEYRVPYPLVLGAEDAALTFSMRAVPVTILLDRRGRIAKVITGSVDEPTLIADVEALLREHEGVSP